LLKTKVLLVDDEVEFASALAERLRLRGYDARAEARAEHALTLIQNDPPDVVLLDFRMPGMDGLEALRKIRQTAPSVNIIMLTWLEDSHSIEEAKKIGALEYIMKPADIHELIGKIEKAGGVVAAIEDGFIQRQIENSAYEYQQEIEKGERIIVGVNEFQIDEQTKPPLLRVNPEVENAQVKGLKELRQKRDNKKVEEALENLSKCARSSSNLMPEILAAVKTYATLGEICQVLREVFGEYRG
jgi:DNA-binding NarL/FixJ family response regulator